MNLDYFKNNFNLKDSPGVYFFYDKDEIIYIGKATSLKDRVRSYFSNDLIKTRGLFLVDMVSKANRITTIETTSVLEALLLESELIKKHQPYYNTKEKDDKSKSFIVISKDDVPVIKIMRGKDMKASDGVAFYGPFLSQSQVVEILKIIRKIFPYRDDKCKMNGAQCFNSYLGMCPTCVRDFDKKRYLKTIDKIKLFLSGQTQKVIDNLEKEMMVLAKKMHFEDAKVLRDQIYKLKHINDIALIKNENIKKIINTRIEAYDVAHMMGKDMVGVMIVSDGNNFDKKEYKKFIIKNIENANDPLALEQILTRRFEHKEWSYPDYIIVDGNNIQISVAKKVLSLYKLDEVIKVCAVTKDDKHKANYVYTEGGLEESVIVAANVEAHRFAINYYRYKSRKSFLGDNSKNLL